MFPVAHQPAIPIRSSSSGRPKASLTEGLELCTSPCRQSTSIHSKGRRGSAGAGSAASTGCSCPIASHVACIGHAGYRAALDAHHQAHHRADGDETHCTVAACSMHSSCLVHRKPESAVWGRCPKISQDTVSLHCSGLSFWACWKAQLRAAVTSTPCSENSSRVSYSCSSTASDGAAPTEPRQRSRYTARLRSSGSSHAYETRVASIHRQRELRLRSRYTAHRHTPVGYIGILGHAN